MFYGALDNLLIHEKPVYTLHRQLACAGTHHDAPDFAHRCRTRPLQTVSIGNAPESPTHYSELRVDMMVANHVCVTKRQEIIIRVNVRRF